MCLLLFAISSFMVVQVNICFVVYLANEGGALSSTDCFNPFGMTKLFCFYNKRLAPIALEAMSASKILVRD